MIDLGDWNERLAPLFADEKYKKIRAFLIEEYQNHVVYPDMYDLYNCFKYTPFSNLKAVILGQDPYHGEGQAHGLCFSVKKNIDIPPFVFWQDLGKVRVAFEHADIRSINAVIVV